MPRNKKPKSDYHSLSIKIIYLLGKNSKKIRRRSHKKGNYYWGMLSFIKDGFGMRIVDNNITEEKIKNLFKK